MRVKTQNYNNVTVVELQGEFDADFADMFQNTITDIIAAHQAGIVVDMRGVPFVDSRGLESLLWARDYSSENNCQLKLAGLDENCKKILEITRIGKEFDRYSELAEAVKSFA